MAGYAIWGQDANNNYINLFENQQFREKLLGRKSNECLKFNLKKKITGKKLILQSINATLNQNPNFYGLSGSVGIHSTPVVGRCIQADVDINFDVKIAQCDAYVAVVDHTEKGYCVGCVGELQTNARNQYPCLQCGIRFCTEICRDNRIHGYECGTAFHSIVFGTETIMKCAIQMVFKALSIFRNVQSLRQNVHDIISNPNLNGVPQSVQTDIERFACVMSLQTPEYIGFERQLFEAFSIIMQLPQIERLFR